MAKSLTRSLVINKLINRDLKEGEKMDFISSQAITKKQLFHFKLKDKVRCPACGNLLTNIYEDAHGLFTVKCLRCKNEVLVDADNMTVHLIKEAN